MRQHEDSIEQTRATSPHFEKAGECLYRHPPSGTYYGLLKVRGKQIRKSLRTKSLPEARRLLKEFKATVAAVDPGSGRITVSALCDRYEGTIGSQAAKTIVRKVTILSRIRERWGNTPAQKVRKSEILAWLAGFSFGAPSYNLYLECVRAVFQLAVDDRVLAASPVAGIQQKKRSRPIRATPSVEEFRAIVASIRGQRFADTAQESADFIEFLGLSGIGTAETAALAWANIDLDRGQILVFRKKTRTGFAIPIYPQLRPLLERRFAATTAANRGAPDGKVFAVLDPKKAIAAACKRLKLPAYSARAFRRLFCTGAIERGVDIKVLSTWQGHQDGGRLLLSTYSHVRPGHSDAMAALMTAEPAA